MTIEQLIERLKLLQHGGDAEAIHVIADKLLLEFINNPEVTELFDSIEKWYA
jgi:hypothetical protein